MTRKIAICDDEKDLNELMRSYLIKEGYQVVSFYTYQQANSFVDDNSIDLWLLDIMLDEKSGFDLFEQIKAIYPNKPVVFISARDKEFDRIIGLEKGSDDYITKPFNMKEVVLRINNLMKRVYKEEESLVVDGYSIIVSQRKVADQNKNVPLTVKEFELLMMFIENDSVALSREDILNKIWHNDYDSDRVVDDTVRRIRKKLPNLNVSTIHGFGYRLH